MIKIDAMGQPISEALGRSILALIRSTEAIADTVRMAPVQELMAVNIFTNVLIIHASDIDPALLPPRIPMTFLGLPIQLSEIVKPTEILFCRGPETLGTIFNLALPDV